MGNPEDWFEERAESLATVILTRLANVSLEKRPNDETLDLLVNVGGKGLGGRVFGVEVKGTRKRALMINSNGVLKSNLTKQIRARTVLQEFRFPVAIMVVDVVADNAAFGWILEPSGQYPRLTSPVHIHTKDATLEVLQMATQQVERWYAHSQSH